MKILGYSERGIINSLIFNIGDDKDLMSKFIGLIDFPKTFELGSPKDYTILLEQSFSRFGDADLVILIHYEKAEDKKVLFIEGKVKTSNGNWNIQSQFDKYIDPIKDVNKMKHKNYWSNLFSQLYLKNLLIERWDDINNDNKFVIDTPFLGQRKIGTNRIVLNAFNLIKCTKNKAHYIGLIPTSKVDLDNFKGKLDFDMHFLLWEKVHDFCKKEEKLKDVLEIFEYNKGQIYKYDL